MRRQKNTQKVKEQGQNTPDLTNEEEIGSVPEKEFRIKIVKMIQNLGNGIDKMQETFNKDVEERGGGGRRERRGERGREEEREEGRTLL